MDALIRAAIALVALLASASATAGEPAFLPAFDRTYAPVPVVGPALLGDREVVVVLAPADRALRIRCPHRVPSAWRAEVDLAHGTVATIARDRSGATADGGTLYLPPPGTGGPWWAVDGVGCDVDAVVLSTDPTRLDRAEDRAGRTDGGVPALRTELAAIDAFADDAPVRRALDDAPDDATWWSRYAALRPVGGFVPFRALFPGDGDLVRAAPVPGDPPTRHLAAGVPSTIAGPAQVQVVARVLDAPGDACLTLDHQAPVCLASAPLDVPTVVDRWLVARPAEVDGVAVGGALRWSLYVPPGRHVVSLDRDALVHGRVVDLTALRTVAPLPTVPVVVTDTGAPVDPDARLVAEPARGEVGALLFVPGAWRVPEPDAVAWVRTADVGDGRWWTADGRVPVLLDRSDDACRLTLPDRTTWVTTASGRLHTWLPPVGSLDPAAPPRIEGCGAWLRVEGSTSLPRERRLGLLVVAVDRDDAAELRWTAPQDGDVRLSVAVPAGTIEVRVTARGSEGAVETFVVAPDPSAVGVDASGRAWTAPVTIAVHAPGWRLRVQTDVPALVRAVGTATRAPGAPGEMTDRPAVGVVEATRALAAATTRRDRALALLDRSTALGALGEHRDALADAAIAADLGADVEADALAVRWLVETRAAWATPGAWTPLSSGWVPVLAGLEPGDLTALTALARDGRDVDVARALRPLLAPVPWWTSAAREQTLTADDALDAVVDVARSRPADPEHPAFSAIRSWSRWTTAPSIRGTEGYRAPWPEDDASIALRRLLLPGAAPEAVALRSGDTLALPPLPHGGAVRLRCTARDPAAADAPCRLRLADVDGRTIATALAPAFGAPVTLSLPPGRTSTFLDLDAAGEVLADVVFDRVPHGLEALAEVRRTTAPTATLDVLGPTVVAIEAWRPGDPGVLTARVEGETRRLVLGAVPARTLLTIPEGDHRVRLDAPLGTLLRVSVRVPRERESEPPGHASLLTSLRRPSAPVLLDATPEPTVPLPSVGALPRRERPWTLLAETTFGIGGDVSEDPEAARVVPLRGSQSVTIASRPGAKPLWLEVGAGVIASSGFATITDVRAQVEGWWFGAPLDGWLRGDVDARTALTEAGTTALRGTVEGGIAIRPRRWLDVRISTDAGAATRIGAWSPTDAVPSVLWSSYREAHPLWVQPEVQLRAYPTPWMRGRAWARLLTNPPGDAIVPDAITAGLDVRFSAPSLYGLVGVGLQHRPIDVDRALAYTTPLLYGSVRGTFWTRADVAFSLRADADYNAHFRRVTFDLGIEVLWGGRRALGDLRPLRTDARFATTWREPGRWVGR